MSESFQVGDVVQLRSGGTRMTVAEIDAENIVCVWFVRTTLHREAFPAGILMKYVYITPVIRP